MVNINPPQPIPIPRNHISYWSHDGYIMMIVVLLDEPKVGWQNEKASDPSPMKKRIWRSHRGNSRKMIWYTVRVVVAPCQKYRGFSPWLIGQWKITCSSWAQDDSIPCNVLQVPEKVWLWINSSNVAMSPNPSFSLDWFGEKLPSGNWT